MRRTQHAKLLDPCGQGDGSLDLGTCPLHGLDDLLAGISDELGVEEPQVATSTDEEVDSLVAELTDTLLNHYE